MAKSRAGKSRSGRTLHPGTDKSREGRAGLVTLLGTSILQVRVTTEDLDEDEFRKSAKLQIANLFHHVLETLVRLFLAHSPGVRCLWVEMTREHM
jgi:hypothetical protein